MSLKMQTRMKKKNKKGQPNEQSKNKNNNIIRNKTREQLACTVR